MINLFFDIHFRLSFPLIMTNDTLHLGTNLSRKLTIKVGRGSDDQRK